MYYLVEISETKNEFTTFRVVEKEPKTLFSSERTVFCRSSHNNKLKAVEAMLQVCSRNRDFMYIEREQYTYEELCALVGEWRKESAIRNR
jgi:hypothetical protein